MVPSHPKDKLLVAPLKSRIHSALYNIIYQFYSSTNLTECYITRVGSRESTTLFQSSLHHSFLPLTIVFQIFTSQNNTGFEARMISEQFVRDMLFARLSQGSGSL